MAPPRPLAFYLRLLYGGGAERVMVNLMQGLVGRGWPVDLVLHQVAGPYLAEVPEAVRVVDLRSPRMIQGLPPLVQYVRQRRPWALVSALHYANEIAIAAKLLAQGWDRLTCPWGAAPPPSPVFVTEHNTLSVHSQRRSTERWACGLARLTYPWADGVITVSQGAAADLARVTRLPPQRVTVIYNPVITPHLLRQSQEPLDHPWFAPGEPPVIVGVGRLEPQKDFPTLLQGFALLPPGAARLMILGSGVDRLALQDLARSLGVGDRVKFLGFVANPYAYLARAGVFALSSAWEGLPTVLIEALALGTPVVATDCPSGPREILAGGRYGRLVPVGDAGALARALGEALQETAGEWRGIGGDRAGVRLDRLPPHLQPYSLDTATDRYLQVLGLPPYPPGDRSWS